MKVKIHRKEILDLCNWKHEDIGTFIKFLDGLCVDGYLIADGETVPIILGNSIPQTDHLCGKLCKPDTCNFTRIKN